MTNEITGMSSNVHAIINIPICTLIEDIQVVTCQDTELQRLKSYII